MRNRADGFTLLELMIVLVVMAILVASAVAAYDFAVVKSRRSAAASCLTEAAQAMERRYTTCLAYNSAPNAAIPPVCAASNAPPSCGNATQLSRFYAAPSFFAGPAARTYTLQIVPVGPQLAKDKKCGTLRVDQAGTKSVTGTALAKPSECF
ncbi:MAG: type IV pilin protein [Thermomonas sp.]